MPISFKNEIDLLKGFLNLIVTFYKSYENIQNTSKEEELGYIFSDDRIEFRNQLKDLRLNFNGKYQHWLEVGKLLILETKLMHWSCSAIYKDGFQDESEITIYPFVNEFKKIIFTNKMSYDVLKSLHIEDGVKANVFRDDIPF